MVKQFSLTDWFEKLALRVIPYQVYLSLDEAEAAYLVLYKYENSPEKSWGWRWGSWLSNLFAGDEFYEKLNYEEKKALDRALYEYVEKLANQVPNEKKAKLEKMI
jgi:hypothetical protein